MAIELATQFQAYTDEQFYSESKTSLVTNKDFSFDGAKTIKLYKVKTTDMEDFNRNGPILDGLNVVKIASNRLPEKFGFMIAHPVATVAPVKLAEYKIHLDPPFLSGSLVEGRIYYDAFVLENKAKAIYYQAIA